MTVFALIVSLAALLVAIATGLYVIDRLPGVPRVEPLSPVESEEGS